VGEEEFAALIEDAPHDHGERVADPGLGGFGVEGIGERSVTLTSVWISASVSKAFERGAHAMIGKR